ncbi:alpha/beta fold hydrolase [Aliterella atlantica]|uniref:Esterase n=1 Tax=Aliterella atlantica CENA595 TaxID=1618023 RepID=A0A0D8ZYB2_9CYAN|nr:alpha/beta hydrolase [Aliterella atlantica]KJH73397.1 esterase [Aliterella atlantica CENA595]
MATIEILGIQHAYELTGPAAGPHTLVFIHGWLLSREYWQPLIERLSPDYQCLAYDLRGFGQSASGLEVTKLGISAANSLNGQNSLSLTADNVDLVASITQEDPLTECNSRYTAAAYANDLVSLLEQLNINSAWLVGHSLGATIALWAAEQLPDRIKGVICVNAGGGIYLKEAFEQFRSAGRQLVKIRPRWLCYLPLIDLLFTRANVVRPIARSWGRQRVIDFVVAHPEAALGTLLDSTTEEEVNRLPQLVSQLSQPVYFLAGEQDQIMESKYVRHLASFHPLFEECGNNVVEIPRCGHLAMLEQTDTVAQEIQAILNRHQM